VSCGHGTIACGCGHGCVMVASLRRCRVIVASPVCRVRRLLSWSVVTGGVTWPWPPLFV
jgi:hypothetical protein